MTWGGIDALGKPVVIQEENTSPKTAIPLKESRDLADNRIGGMWETREDEIKQNFEIDPLSADRARSGTGDNIDRIENWLYNCRISIIESCRNLHRNLQ